MRGDRTKGLFSDVYNADRQYENSKFNDVQSHKFYLGRLRLDSIIGGRVVVTDEQLLDGAFFLSAASSKLFEDIPFDYLEVSSGAGCLENALLNAARPISPTVQSCLRFLPIAEELRDTVSLQLRARENEIRSWRDIPKALRTLGVEPSLTERLEAGWARWLDAEKSGRLAVRRSDRSFPKRSALNEILGGQWDDLMESCRSEEGQRAARYAWDNRGIERDQVTAELTRRLGVCADEKGQKDINAVISWFDRGYTRAAAEQGACAFCETTDRIDSTAVGGARKLFDGLRDRMASGSMMGWMTSRIGVLLPSYFVAALDEMDKDTYLSLLKSQQRTLETWYGSGEFDRLSEAAMAIFDTFVKSGAALYVSRPRPDWVGSLRLITQSIDMRDFDVASEAEPIVNAARRGFDYLGAIVVENHQLFSKSNRKRIARRIVEKITK